jgi:hypothetical protein
LHILIIVVDRYKRDGKEAKEIPLSGTGYYSYIDLSFRYPPFSNVKQAYAKPLDAMEGVTEADWETKRAKLRRSSRWRGLNKIWVTSGRLGWRRTARTTAVVPRRWSALPVGSPQECVTEMPRGDARIDIESCGYARMAIEMRCVCWLNKWFVCKQYEQKPGRNGLEMKSEYGKKYAQYEQKYAEYDKKYAEYDKTYAVYENTNNM